jgi:acetylglutamate kinase
VNADIVRMLGSHGAEAIGVSGIDAGLFTATPKDERLGFVGEITGVNTGLIERLLAEGLVPVVAPVALGPEGSVYNVNADTAAGALASALNARKLVYLTDTEGVMRNVADDSSLIQRMDLTDLKALLPSIEGGMLPKLTSVAASLEAGVKRAHILDGRVQHVLLLEMFTREGIGTMVTQDGDDRP